MKVPVGCSNTIQNQESGDEVHFKKVRGLGGSRRGCQRATTAGGRVGWHLSLAGAETVRVCGQTKEKSTCSDGWYITGYYVPRAKRMRDSCVDS